MYKMLELFGPKPRGYLTKNYLQAQPLQNKIINTTATKTGGLNLPVHSPLSFGGLQKPMDTGSLACEFRLFLLWFCMWLFMC